MPIGTSTSPVLLILPTREKIFVPLLVSVPRLGEPGRAAPDDIRDGGPGLDVVDHRRLSPEALLGGVGRPLPGVGDPSFHGGDQGGLFSGDEGPGALDDFDIEIESGPKDVLSEQAVLPGLADGDVHALDRQRVFVPDVDESLLGPDRFRPDDHPFENGVGIGLEDGPVHEGARVPFVAVADEVLGRRSFLCGRAPTSCRSGSPRRLGPGARRR